MKTEISILGRYNMLRNQGFIKTLRNFALQRYSGSIKVIQTNFPGQNPDFSKS